ncbi:glycosyltransferase family 2 protein [Olleya sp. Bg11-27]|uniref:glycosyltransferase family 2 protein n=1 Tax=Olleya sp. Bg11-27 TaxID=2058135 RepID=UPI000C30F544|nr:glycosyltransferase [Olleya sp. Bg11-27]AUC75817.1 hypothetical protein CW732_09045 [Olleya sp. Bg11-27]
MTNIYKNSLVSIIIPCYNNANHIIETLTSVLNQTYTHWECLIIDDDSTDNTIKILEKWCLINPKFSYLKRPGFREKGANACRNVGIENSQGIYVIFLDADDILNKYCLENRVKEFDKNHDLDFVIANTSFYSDGVFLDKAICRYPENYTAEQYLNLFLKYELPWTIMSVLWKRETIVNVSFDETLPRLQDVDFHIQILLQNNLKCIRLSTIDTYYRSNTNSKTTFKHNQIVINASNLFFEKYLTKPFLNSTQKKQFRRFIMLFLFKHIYPSQKELKVEVQQIEVLIKNSKLFTIKELLLLKIYKLIIKYNLQTKTGLGVHKLTKALKNGLNYDR